jgi:bifunctional NMN adenylyltransferase/nudix hydrolase
MSNKFDIALFIGRFQPFHLGHLAVINQALDTAKHVVVLVGSSSGARTMRNPWTFEERKRMLEDSLGVAQNRSLALRIHIQPLNDYTYNDSMWLQQVQNIVDRTAWKIGYTDEPRVALIGHSKDHSSYYLKMFPQWHSVEVDNHEGLNSTHMRAGYFGAQGNEFLNALKQQVSPTTLIFLSTFQHTDTYKHIRNEFEFIQKYKHSWANAPYAPTFVTVDAIVVQSGHVLLVRRRAAPGKGMWAMPGGFLNAQERIDNAVLRELREETGIRVPEAVLRGSIVCKDVFDDPNRSERGRTITHCYLIKLKDDTQLPKVRGMDDADRARWVPIASLKPQDFFEDHYHILTNMLARI